MPIMARLNKPFNAPTTTIHFRAPFPSQKGLAGGFPHQSSPFLPDLEHLPYLARTLLMSSSCHLIPCHHRRPSFTPPHTHTIHIIQQASLHPIIIVIIFTQSPSTFHNTFPSHLNRFLLTTSVISSISILSFLFGTASVVESFSVEFLYLKMAL